MSFNPEAVARDIVLSLYYAADGRPRWWPIPTEMQALEREALELALSRGWLIAHGRFVCLTKVGLDLCERDATGQ